LKKNVNEFLFRHNPLQNEYKRVLKNIFRAIRDIEYLKIDASNAQNLSKLELIKLDFDKSNSFANRKINELIQDKKINNLHIVSLINDNNYYSSIVKHFLIISFLLWIDDDLKELKLSDEILDMLNSTNRYKRLNDGKAN